MTKVTAKIVVAVIAAVAAIIVALITSHDAGGSGNHCPADHGSTSSCIVNG
jgi:hypothetical protein